MTLVLRRRVLGVLGIIRDLIQEGSELAKVFDVLVLLQGRTEFVRLPGLGQAHFDTVQFEGCIVVIDSVLLPTIEWGDFVRNLGEG